EARQGILATPAYAGIRIVDSIRVQASAQAVQASAQTAQCRCISPWRLHSSAQERQKAVQFASSASSSWRWPALLERAMMLPVALQTAAQSRFSRMHGTRCDTSRSDRHASAQAVHVSTALKHASMQRLMASECAGFSGWERNMARTATADMARSFSTPEAKQARAQLVPIVINRCQNLPKWNSAAAGTVTTELL